MKNKSSLKRFLTYGAHKHRDGLAEHSQQWATLHAKTYPMLPLVSYKWAHGEDRAEMNCCVGAGLVFTVGTFIVTSQFSAIGIYWLLAIVGLVTIGGMLLMYSFTKKADFEKTIVSWKEYISDFELFLNALIEAKLAPTCSFEENKKNVSEWLELAYTQIVAKEGRGEALDATELKKLFRRIHQACLPFGIGTDPKFKEHYEKVAS